MVINTFRLYLDQGFGEGKGNENEKVRRSNRSGLLNPLSFSFLFPYPSPSPSSKHSLRGGDKGDIEAIMTSLPVDLILRTLNACSLKKLKL